MSGRIIQRGEKPAAFYFLPRPQKFFVDFGNLPDFTSVGNLLFFHSLDNVKSTWSKFSIRKTCGRFWEEVILIL
jgi:hypothetical protein